MKVLFDKSAKKIILEALGKTTDSEGYIIENTSRKRVITPDGEEITEKEFAGVIKGSEIFLKSDIASLLRYYDRTHATTS